MLFFLNKNKTKSEINKEINNPNFYQASNQQSTSQVPKQEKHASPFNHILKQGGKKDSRTRGDPTIHLPLKTASESDFAEAITEQPNLDAQNISLGISTPTEAIRYLTRTSCGKPQFPRSMNT